MKDKKTITIIDTFGFLFRSFYALPPLKSASGEPTGMLTGFMNFIYTLGKNHEADNIIFALDSKGDTFRHSIYLEYKANRQEAPIELKQQLPIAIEWIKKMGFKTLSAEGFEADDIIATVCSYARGQNCKVRIVSHDKDLNQLLNEDVFLFDPIKKIDFSYEDCYKKFSIKPEQFVHYQAIIGDSSDNIPGVKGLGPKGAVKLLSVYETLENIYENIDLITPSRAKNLLLEYKEDAFMSKSLATLRDDADIEINLDECKYPTLNPILQIQDELIAFSMENILQRVSNQGMYVKTKTIENNLVFESILLDNLQDVLEVLEDNKNKEFIVFDTESDGLEIDSKIVGFSFCFDKKKAYYIPIAHKNCDKQLNMQQAKIAIEKILDFKLLAHNIKFDMHILSSNFDIEKFDIYADSMILGWLLDPSISVSLDALSYKFLQHKCIKFQDTVQKNETFADVPIEKALKYASEDVVVCLGLYEYLIDKIDDDIKSVATKVEYPFISTLWKIEKNGIKVNIDFLKDFQIKADDMINQLTQQIYSLAGCEFNINSTKQLAKVLFEELGLKSTKKTKTGFSTDEQSLNEIKNDHKIVQCILNYKEIYKLQSTYIKPLEKLASLDNEQKIHTSFLQTGTTSGRLSSSNPNLQNIPVRSKMGREIRKAFIADDGHMLIGIDYSQIELRLLAHFSGDDYLLKAFSNNDDIHLQTAIKLFGEDEAKDKRNIAKSINFGILYGMGSRKLAKVLDVPTKEAKEYIENYFKLFTNVEKTIQSIKTFMQEYGYTETLLKRKRFFDFKNASAFESSNYLRMGVNNVFQGSGADLIKMSMNKIYQKYQNQDVKILLQIHDEVILQAPKDIAQKVADECANIMDNITSLDVKLKTSVHIGHNWEDLK